MAKAWTKSVPLPLRFRLRRRLRASDFNRLEDTAKILLPTPVLASRIIRCHFARGGTGSGTGDSGRAAVVAGRPRNGRRGLARRSPRPRASATVRLGRRKKDAAARPTQPKVTNTGGALGRRHIYYLRGARPSAPLPILPQRPDGKIRAWRWMKFVCAKPLPTHAATTERTRKPRSALNVFKAKAGKSLPCPFPNVSPTSWLALEGKRAQQWGYRNDHSRSIACPLQ